MSEQTDISDMELAALISSRICHDVIGPVGAIANGMEVLDEEDDAEVREFALDTIRRSAASASAKLQFARLAFGASGAPDAEMDLRDAEKVARGFAEGGRHTLNWNCSLFTLPKDKAKLLLNMIPIALTILPTGGIISVSVNGDASAPAFELLCEGRKPRIPEGVAEIIDENARMSLDARSIQPYYTGRLAKSVHMKLAITERGEDIIFSATS